MHRSERHIVIAQPEVVSELMNHRLADLLDGLFAGAGDAEDWAAEDRDLIGEERHAVGALGHRDAAVEAEELGAAFIGIVIEGVEIAIARLFLDHDDDVVEEIGEAGRQLAEGFLDELLEFSGSYQPGVMLNP